MPELQDLAEVIRTSRERISGQDPSKEISIDATLWERIKNAYGFYQPGDNLDLIGGHTIKIVTPEGKRLFISSQEMPQVWAVIPYARAIAHYETVVDELARDLGFAGRNSVGAREIFSKLPRPTWRADISPETVARIDAFIDGRFADEADRERFRLFLSARGAETGVSKDLNRSDWVSSAIPFVGEWLAVGAARRGDLVIALARDPQIETGLGQAIENADAAEKTGSMPETDRAAVTGGDNVLFYGAPGTGKSHAVDLRVGSGLAFRTVFHPDMQNSDFVGALKPGSGADGKVTYEFRPGPFARAVAWAWANPNEPAYLVIEELNRAMAAAVFGELFQLLDRNADGSGRYEVDFPSPEFGEWFRRETGTGMNCLQVPSNLWILATMNSADQGVYPLDTAFRRRWTQVYIPIDYRNAPEGEVRYRTTTGPVQTSWRHFVETLNDFLIDTLQIGEDRLIGPRFVSEADLAQEQLPSKLMIYLWDDLLRHHGRDFLFAPAIHTYGDIHRRLHSDQPVFSSTFLAKLGARETDHDIEELEEEYAEDGE